MCARPPGTLTVESFPQLLAQQIAAYRKFIFDELSSGEPWSVSNLPQIPSRTASKKDLVHHLGCLQFQRLPEETATPTKDGNTHATEAPAQPGCAQDKDAAADSDVLDAPCTPQQHRRHASDLPHSISHQFTQPATMKGTGLTYNFPSPMHAVLIQYDKPVTCAAEAVPRRASPVTDHRNRKTSEDKKQEDEDSTTTKFIQKLVRRSSSFRKLQEIREMKQQLKENRVPTMRTVDIPTDLHTGAPFPQHVNHGTQRSMSSSENCENIRPSRSPASPLHRNSDASQRRRELRSRSRSMSHLSVTSSDAGYFSFPNSPQGSLKFDARHRTDPDLLVKPAQEIHPSQGRSSRRESYDQKHHNRKQILNEVSNNCKRSHSFSGATSAPLSVWRQPRPRSLSSASLTRSHMTSHMTHVERSLRDTPRVTLSFAAFVSDVQDTFL